MLRIKLAFHLAAGVGQAIVAGVFVHIASSGQVTLALIGFLSTVVANLGMLGVAWLNHRGIQDVQGRVGGVEQQVGAARAAARESADTLSQMRPPNAAR